MTLKEQNIDLFDSYQRRKLTEPERKTFDQRLTTDTEFSQAFDEYIGELNVIKAIGAGEEMRAIMANHKEENASGTFRLKYLIPIGIAAGLILAFLFFPNNTNNHKDLFETYYEPFPNLISARDNTSDLAEALNAFSATNYSLAIEKFENLPSETDTILFYQGLSHLSIKETNSALLNLNKISSESPFYEYATWYKGLAHLLANRLDSAEFYLNLVDDNSTHIKESKNILKAIK